MRHHLLLLRGQACTLEAAPLLQLLLLRRESLDLALLKMALVLWRLCGWRGRQLLGPWGLGVLKSDSRDLSEFSGRKLLLDCFQAWILSLLEENEKFLCTRSHSLLRVLGVISQKLRPRVLMSCHFERKIKSTSRQIRVRELQHFAMQHRQFYQISGEIEDQCVCRSDLAVPLKEPEWGCDLDIEIESLEHLSLHLQDFLFGVGVVSNVDKISYNRRIYFFVFAGYEHSCNSDKLQFLSIDLLLVQVPVNEVDSEV